MQGDFSVIHFDPQEHERVVNPPAQGVLRNLSGVLHQQGRVMSDADLTEGELLELVWNGQAGRDIIGAGVCAVPASEPLGFQVVSTQVVNEEVRVLLRPGRAWVDGILTRLAGVPPDPLTPVVRLATYFGPPLSTPLPTPMQIVDGIRDAVILEVSQEALHGFQYPQRLIEPALGGPDTAERAFVNFRVRLLRLADGEDCTSVLAKLRDDPSAKGRLSVSLAPVVAIAGDCPVVGGGGYTGFEHCLYRIEIADVPPATAPRFKWSQCNGGLTGRGRFDATSDPDRVIIDAGRAAIVNSGLTEFYLEALQYDELIGAWTVVYGTIATLNTDHDLELASPPSFGTLPATTDSVFLRLWNGIADIGAFPDVANPLELRDGIRLAFDAAAAGNYRPGDYWTFTVRAGEIANPQILINKAPPVGIVYHRVPLAEINWTARRDTTISGSIEDCRKHFRPLTNQKICCTFLIGDGVSSFGDFNSLEEAAVHLPAAGGELCLLPGLHRANLRLEGRRNVKIHGCRWRTMVLPRTETRAQPILHFIDCVGIEVCELDLVTLDAIAVSIDGSNEDSCQDVRIHDNRMIARTNAIRASNAAELTIACNRLHLLDTVDGRATISVLADDVLIERNALLLLPFIDETTEKPDQPDDDPTRDPADPCARPEILYKFPRLVLLHAFSVWALLITQILPKQPYRAIGGIHVRAGSERVRILENTIVGGAGNGITLGGDLDPAPTPPEPDEPRIALTASANSPPPATVTVTDNGQFLALVQDEQGKPLADVELYLKAETEASDRSDAQGMTSIMTAPGTYTLEVSPQYRVVRVTEARNERILVNAVTLAPSGRTTARGFLHEITIEANDIAMMGLSGIGFALRTGISITGSTKTPPTNDPKAALLSFIDAAPMSLALTLLLRATDLVRDLVILNNRVHHNLRNPFTEALLADAQFIGRGGVSLAIVTAAVISGNHVYENGPRASDPVCGVFVGYGDNLEITGNVLTANGATITDLEAKRNAGICGGLYICFAGAFTTRNAAFRVHDNRVDQPAGRALTAYAFGPVSVANNHFNSEFCGTSGVLDTAGGSVLLLNFGGIHRLLARIRLGRFMAFERTAAEWVLPGGETMFNDNYVRLGLLNRSITSQVLLTADDLSYASNTAAVYRGDPFFANAVLMADSVRATASRLREDVTQSLSLLTMAMRMNMTVLNQADHCIVAQTMGGPNPLPTVDQPNQVLDGEMCNRLFAEPSDIVQFLVRVLAANANQLGGTLQQNAFSSTKLATLTQRTTAQALNHINATQVATTRVYQTEALRMAAKHGADHPASRALAARGAAGAQISRLLASSAQALAVSVPVTPEGGSTFSGRLVNDRGQGLADYSVELLQTNGTLLGTVGRTDTSGFFSAAYDKSQTAALNRSGEIFARVMDFTAKEVLFDKTPLHFTPGADVQVTLVVPVRVVPKSVVVGGTVIYGTPVPTPEPPAPTPPPETDVRTPLDTLGIDDATRRKLMEGGIVDVEGILETTARKLAGIVGSEEMASRLTEMAKRQLDSTPTKPDKPRVGRTPNAKATPKKATPQKATPKKTTPKKPK
ncbi:right-handed parallel beta-helix repeat-containing protein [Pseudomonas akapageensis]|uniref:right-handed parallel beta-helix repeat-containing protein n=1 Tax=Pseudomonas akapageensis TaxID=2609961 RepID=UPI001409216F|nr:right-handed parallel beta-helix repeat-containing protein [Pseudomonas akapageensis]